MHISLQLRWGWLRRRSWPTLDIWDAARIIWSPGALKVITPINRTVMNLWGGVLLREIVSIRLGRTPRNKIVATPHHWHDSNTTHTPDNSKCRKQQCRPSGEQCCKDNTAKTYRHQRAPSKPQNQAQQHSRQTHTRIPKPRLHPKNHSCPNCTADSPNRPLTSPSHAREHPGESSNRFLLF